jgi:CRP-like cAMP-binding protein
MTVHDERHGVGRDAAVSNRTEVNNRLLAALPATEYARLEPHLERVLLQLSEVLVETGGALEHVYFPTSAVISVVRSAGDGTQVETGTIGQEGFAGLAVALGTSWSAAALEAQVPGECLRMSSGEFREALREMPMLQRFVGIFVLAFLDQTGQSVVCNSRHALPQRCARWLLMAHDRIPGDTFHLTQDVLSRMLGVRRAGVSEAMVALKAAGTVDYRRGQITVLDRSALESVACVCYAINRRHLDALYSELSARG